MTGQFWIVGASRSTPAPSLETVPENVHDAVLPDESVALGTEIRKMRTNGFENWYIKRLSMALIQKSLILPLIRVLGNNNNNNNNNNNKRESLVEIGVPRIINLVAT